MTKNFEIVYRNPAELIPYEMNAKKHDEQQIRDLAAAIKKRGFDQPITVDKHDVIITGHGRREAALLAGLERVPVIVRDDLSEEEVKAKRLEDNRLASIDYDAIKLQQELESLVQNLKGLKRARFWMTFSENYLNHLKVLGNVGMTRIDPVRFQGQDIVPIQFLRALLPDPASLGPLTKGKTCIGNVMRGIKDGKEKTVYIYNICDHEACYAEVGSQAISYTTGVPAMIGAKMMVSGQWLKPGVWNMEQFDPDPFMADLNAYGLPWQCVEVKD